MLSKQNRISVLIILLFIFGWISINIYLPALPYLVHDFHTDPQSLKFSVTLFLLGFAFSQLIWGPMSEKYGRKRPTIWGLVMTNIGIVLAMLAPNVFIFNSGRFIEAVGLGCAPVLGRAILIDALPPLAFSATMTYGTISANLMPALAPIIGGYLLMTFGWRSIFAFLLIYGLFMLSTSLRKLPETHPNIQHNIKLLHTFKHYTETLTHKPFLGFLFPYILVTGAMIGYYTVTPFIFITHLHLSPKSYGFLSLITVATYLAGAFTNRVVASRLELSGTVKLGITVLLIAALSTLLFAFFSTLSIPSVIIPMAIYTYAAGIICPSSNAGAMHALRHKAGAAAAVIGFSLYLASAVLSSIITAVVTNSLWPLTFYILAIAFLASFAFYGLVVVAERHKK